jgi:hypothetical protein
MPAAIVKVSTTAWKIVPVAAGLSAPPSQRSAMNEAERAHRGALEHRVGRREHRRELGHKGDDQREDEAAEHAADQQGRHRGQADTEHAARASTARRAPR